MDNGGGTNLSYIGSTVQYDGDETARETDLKLQSYDHRWTGKKNKTDLATAGFTYTGIGDKVECDKCGLKLLNWTPTDDPLHEHATRRPLCPFINSRYRQLGQTKPPKHPQYQDLQDRLDSFIAWPERHVPKTPEELAGAGFFYIGSADRVTCFQCGITLRDWEEEHDPVTEHRRYSGNCQFVKKTDVNDLGVVTRNTHTENASIKESVTQSAEPDLETGKMTGASAFPSVFQSSSKPNMLHNHFHPTGDDDSHINQLSAQCLQPAITNTITNDHSQLLVTTEPNEDTTDDRTSPINMLSSLRLSEENQRLREKGTCRVCREKGVAVLFLPCGHLVTCSDCAPKVSECVVCQKSILGTVKTYFT